MTSITVRPLTQDDIALGMRLKAAANWNQTEDDWRRVIRIDPQGAFVGQCNGVDVGTVTAVAFGPVAWIGLMLVDPAARGQGVGKALMQHALATLEARGVSTIRLDATPAGQPLYEKLGFTADFALTRWSGTARKSPPPRLPPDISTVSTTADQPVVCEAIAQFDRHITATDRHPIIQALLDEQPRLRSVLWRDSQCVGYLLSRNGANAVQIGPCGAIDESVGAYLLRNALHALADTPVFVDVPDTNTIAREILAASGLTPQRPLLRMTRGARINERPEAIWAAFGPEKG